MASLENDYSLLLNWLFWNGGATYEPTKSIFPDANGGPSWVVGDIPPGMGGARGQKSVQGWKIHVCVFPNAVENLFDAVADLLIIEKLTHKFFPFEPYKKQKTGYKAFQAIGTDKGDAAAGKACVIYPASPEVIAGIVPKIDRAIIVHNEANRHDKQRRCVPFPGGVKGDLALGRTGFVYCRYGAFSGHLADTSQVYDSVSKTLCPDPRFTKPYPPFIREIPTEIRAVKRG